MVPPGSLHILELSSKAHGNRTDTPGAPRRTADGACSCGEGCAESAAASSTQERGMEGVSEVSSGRVCLMSEDYGIYPFSRVRGELYSGSSRAATWHEQIRGKYIVMLYKREYEHGKSKDTLVAEDEINQTDKARGLCEIWLQTGSIPASMRTARKATANDQ
jgi:hypothetical protein